MSHLYEATIQVTVAAGGPVCTVLTGATRAEILEISLSIAGAAVTSPELSIGYPNASGTGGVSTGVTVLALNPDDPAGVTQLVTAFVTAQPTLPGNPMRRGHNGAGSGAGFIWTWERGELIVAPSTQFSIWSNSGNSTIDCSVKVAE